MPAPFSRRRVRDDLVAALPAVGLMLGAVVGAGLGLLDPAASAVQYAGVGIVVGLLLGLLLRTVWRRD